MSPRSSAAGSMVYGIIVGGYDSDAPEDLSGGCRVYLPGIHGPDVDIKHLAFSPRLMSPTRADQQSFPGGLDPGTLVVATKDTGSNQVQIMGLANDLNQRDSSIPGNLDLLQSIQQIFTTNIQVNVPPTVTESTDRGAKIRKVQEKGQLHNHDLLRGLPTHGALYPMAGMILPQLQNIATATQSFQNVLTADMVSNIPGIIMSLGKMYSMFSGKTMKKITGNMPRETAMAFQSMSMLTQSVESREGAGFSTAGRCDEGTYMDNAEKLLRQVTNLSDLVVSMQRLQNDTKLFGQDKLKPYTNNISTPFGNVSQSIDFNGNMTTNVPDVVKKAVDIFAKQMTSASGFPGIAPGTNMFSGSASTMFEMFQRLSPAALQTAVQMSQTLNTSGTAQSFDRVLKQTVNGGNPFSTMFK